MADGNSMQLLGDWVLTIGVIALVSANFFAFWKVARLNQSSNKIGAKLFNLGVFIGSIIIASIVLIVLGFIFGLYSQIFTPTTFPSLPTLNL